MEKKEFVRRSKILSEKESYTFDDVVEMIELLRCEHGCAWDRQQTHLSIRENAIEEAYELVDAINSGNIDDIAQELGDMLLQCVLHINIAKQSGEFEPTQVYTVLCKKLLARHSHVFGSDVAADADKALEIWEKNKEKERKSQSVADYLRQVPEVTPALLRAYKVQKRASKVGFDWEGVDGALKKVAEETDEVLKEIATKNAEKIEEELGDLLFALVNVFRFCHCNPEVALTRCTQKFIRRFDYVEKALAQKGVTVEQSSLEEMDALWEQCKQVEKSQEQNSGDKGEEEK